MADLPGRPVDHLSTRIEPLVGELPPSVEEAVINAPKLGELAGDLQRIEDPVERAAVARIRIRELEDKAKDLLSDKYGPAYAESASPWMIKLSDLDKADYDEIRQELEELRGLPGVLARGEGPRMIKPLSATQGGFRSRPYGRFVVNTDGDVDANAMWFLTQNIQHLDRPLGEEESVIDLYQSSGNHFTQEALERMAEQRNRLKAEGMPSNYAVLDIESPSLRPDEGLRQLSVRRFEHGQEAEAATFNFPNPWMEMGSYYDIESKQVKGLSARIPAADTGFESGTLQFLETLERADWNMMGASASFDYGHLMHGMKRTRAYREDGHYRELVDKFAEEFTRGENVYDTRYLALQVLGHDIQVAPEIAARDSFSSVSVENILLQTDILERLQHERGFSAEQIDQWLRKGTHDAEVDTRLENEIGVYLINMLHGGDLRVDTTPLQNEEWRRLISGSRAIGPRIQMGIEEVAPELLPGLERAGLLKEGQAQLSPLEHMIMMHHRRTVPLPAGQMDVPGATAAVQDLLSRMFTDEGGLRRKSPFRIPGLEESHALSLEFAQRGLPLAQLHPVELQANALFGRYGFSGVKPGLEREQQFQRRFGSLFGSTVWHRPRKIDVLPNSGIITLPREHLAEIFGPERTRAIPLSVFDLRGGGKEVSQTFRFRPLGEGAEEDYKLVKDYLRKNQAQLNISDSVIGRIFKSLDDRTKTGGIQVATMGGIRGDRATTDLVEALAHLLGVPVDDTNGNNLALSVLNMGGMINKDYERGGAIVSTSAMTEDLYQGISQAVGRQRPQAQEIWQAIQGGGTRATRQKLRDQAYVQATDFRQGEVQRAMTPSGVPALGENLGIHDPSQLREEFRRIFQRAEKGVPEGEIRSFGGHVYQRLTRPALLVGAGVAAIAGASYYFHKRKRRGEQIDDTLALQPYEEGSQGADTPQYQTGAYLPVAPVVSTTQDTLATAGVTRRAYQNRIGHHRMGNNKYAHLYGG